MHSWSTQSIILATVNILVEETLSTICETPIPSYWLAIHVQLLHWSIVISGGSRGDTGVRANPLPEIVGHGS